MSLIVAQKFNGQVYCVSDTQLTPKGGGQLSGPLEGAVKLKGYSSTLMVAFAHHSLPADQAFRDYVIGHDPIEHFLSRNRLSLADDQEAEFMVLDTTMSPSITCIRDGRATSGSIGWLGSENGFRLFQGYRMNKLTPSIQPTNTAQLRFAKCPEGPGGDVSQYQLMMHAMASVIADESAPEVGGFIVPAATHHGKLQFMAHADILTSPIKLEMDPKGEPVVIPFGSAEEGGYSLSFCPNDDAIAIYIVQGRMGLLFPYGDPGIVRPRVFYNVSPLEFEEAAQQQFGVVPSNFFPDVNEIADRAISYFNIKDNDKASYYARKAIQSGKNDFLPNIAMGLALGLLGRPSGAATYLRKAIELKPDDWRAHYYLSMALRDMESYENAMSAVTACINLNRNCKRGFLLRAKLARTLGLLDVAAADEATAQALPD